MFDELVKRGFRIEPQVRCGAFKIDFVVKAKNGDGDRFYGPGQWSDDMAHQRVLERTGWIFWRCVASSWARRREEVVADNTVWVHYKEVNPFQIEEPFAESV